jgi:RES domain-containing protein
MVLWRISNHLDLSGVGAERSSGRWHTMAAGKRMVYLAEHPAVALIEHLVNLDGDPAFFPRHDQLLRLAADAALAATDMTADESSSVEPARVESTQWIGDAWLAAGSSALLRVPSIPSPESWNYLLNPLHPDAAGVRVESGRTITYDERLFHVSHA